MATISCTKARYEELKKNPLLFLRVENNSYYNYKGEWVEDVNWVPADNDFQATIKYSELGDGKQSHLLIVAGDEVVDEKTTNNETEARKKDQ